MIAAGVSGDEEKIINMTKLCAADLISKGISQWDENYPDLNTIQMDIQRGELFKYTIENTIVGIIVLNENQDPEYVGLNWITPASSRNLVVHRLAVHPEHQGKGIARQLMDFGEEKAKQEGYDSIRLDTFTQNKRNQKFYDNRGYQRTGVVYLSYRDDFPYIGYELIL
ncbi:MAG: GNAT family N-acetyltransferase [Crocinitomicaceae bacterium]